MSINFLDHIRTIAEPRISEMLTYPLDEILFSTLVGLLCRAEDRDEIEFMAREKLDWLRRFLPFESGIPQAQTYRRLFATLDPKTLEAAFSNWVSSLQSVLAGVVAIDGKTLCGSKKESSGWIEERKQWVDRRKKAVARAPCMFYRLARMRRVW